MLRVGVQCCTMQSSAASTSCLMKALLSPAFCSKALTVPSSSWSIAFCRLVYRSPSVHTATLDTPERRFLTWTRWTLLIHRHQNHHQTTGSIGRYLNHLTKLNVQIRSETVSLYYENTSKFCGVFVSWQIQTDQCQRHISSISGELRESKEAEKMLFIILQWLTWVGFWLLRISSLFEFA